VDVVVLAIELDQLAFEVGAHRARDLLHPLEVRVIEDQVPVLRHGSQVREKTEVQCPPVRMFYISGIEQVL
jgi:hypothetical protein